MRNAAGGGIGLVLAGGGLRAARLLGVAAAESAPLGTTERFVSRPDLQPPTVSVLRPAAGTADGLLFLTPSDGPGQAGPLLVDDRGEVVWFRRARGGTARNFRAAVYRGEPVLTWWEGRVVDGLERGEHVVADASYRELARFPAGRGRPADLHELLLTPEGTALVTAKEVATRNLTSLGGGRRGRVVAGVVQELHVPSGRLLHEWRSLDHVPLAESHERVTRSWDYFHVNSIDVAPDGHLLVSSRNTWTVYKVHRRTGRILWRLGGKRSDFALGPGAAFAWQHDARWHSGDRLSLFDNGATPQVHPQSRGLVLAVDTARRRVRLLRQYTHHPNKLVAPYQGSVQLLPNGDVLVGWGAAPYFTEFAAGGAVRLDARLPAGSRNYRTLRFPWTGRPSERPRLVSHATGDGKTLYASWNGATELAAWQLRAGASPSSLADAARVPSQGFETAFAAPGGALYAAVVALDRDGNALGSSAAVRV